MRNVFSISLASLALAVGCAHGSGGDGTVLLREDTTGITVTGDGDAEAVPDTAVFRIGVEARRPTVAEARDTSARAQQAVIAALRSGGIAENHIQTQQLTIQPDYEYTEAGRRLLGYVATNTVQVRSTDLDRLSQTIDAAVTAGGDVVRLEGIQFELDDPEAVRAQAREKAVARARAKAQQLAQLLGARLGPAVFVEEVSSAMPPQPMMRMEAAAADAATPIQRGTTEVRVEVRVRFAIER